MPTDPNDRLDRIVSELLNVKELVATEAAALRGGLQDFRNDSLAQFDHIASALARLQSEYHALAAAVGRLEKTVGAADPESARQAIGEQIAELKKQISELQRRVEQLERAS